jgi:dCTP deaminase
MLSSSEILEEISKGNIVIQPFDERQLNSNSYDLRLGEYIAVGNTTNTVLDVYCEADITRYWSIRKASGRVITIMPQQTILGHTIEVIGGRSTISTKMNARSSMMRSGVSVCKCAGFGDIGYINRWTLEMTNHLDVPVSLKVGMRVAQLSFTRSNKPPIKEYDGKYAARTQWKPEDMLPKLWKDWDNQDGTIKLVQETMEKIVTD